VCALGKMLVNEELDLSLEKQPESQVKNLKKNTIPSYMVLRVS